MPTLPVLDMLEADLGKPVISSASAMMWHALRRWAAPKDLAIAAPDAELTERIELCK
jgi:maleate cis-trans isomerase